MEHSNMFTGTVYQGYNQLFLGIESKEGFTNKWATFLQWKQNGFKVKKGSRGVHCRTFVENTRATAKDKNSKVPKCFVLFNEAQVEAMKEKECTNKDANGNACYDCESGHGMPCGYTQEVKEEAIV